MLPNNLRLGILAVAASSLVAGGSASADILTLRAEAKAGVAGGTGMFGERNEDSFHERQGNLGYGVAVGAEVFLIDGWVSHEQFSDGGDISTWTQFMLGFDVEIDVGENKGTHFNDAGKEVGGYSSVIAELGMGAGFGVGTGQQVDPPLDNGQVTDKGFLLEGHAFVAYRLTKIFYLGVMMPAQFGYFTKSGAGTAANEVDNHYTAVSGSAMLTFRSSWNLK
jgi:hypothetical protein